MHLSQCSSSSSKRDHSNISSPKCQDSLHELPAIPKLLGEVILDVFTHHSLRQPPNASTSAQGASHAYQDERLMELGRNVLSASATQVLFAMKPFLSAEDIAVSHSITSPNPKLANTLEQVRRDEMLSTANVETLIRKYQLREKLRCHPDAISSLHTPEVFHRRPTLILFLKSLYPLYRKRAVCLTPTSVLSMRKEDSRKYVNGCAAYWRWAYLEKLRPAKLRLPARAIRRLRKGLRSLNPLSSHQDYFHAHGFYRPQHPQIPRPLLRRVLVQVPQIP
jgi:hypothetical protein